VHDTKFSYSLHGAVSDHITLHHQMLGPISLYFARRATSIWIPWKNKN